MCSPRTPNRSAKNIWNQTPEHTFKAPGQCIVTVPWVRKSGSDAALSPVSQRDTDHQNLRDFSPNHHCVTQQDLFFITSSTIHFTAEMMSYNSLGVYSSFLRLPKVLLHWTHGCIPRILSLSRIKTFSFLSACYLRANGMFSLLSL